MAALAMLLCMLLTAQAALMAIDLGTDTMKVQVAVRSSVHALGAHAVLLSVSQPAPLAPLLQIAMVGKRDRKPGDSPIEIVLNEGGSRKTPTGVAFARGERVTGGNLATVRSKFPQVGARVAQRTAVGCLDARVDASCWLGLSFHPASEMRCA